MDIGKIPCSQKNDLIIEDVLMGIFDVQSHFMLVPDLVISPNRRTNTFLSYWSKKPVSSKAYLTTPQLKKAWSLVDPLLPQGSRCTSAFRSPTHQRKILHYFFKNKYKQKIIAKNGQSKYDEIAKKIASSPDSYSTDTAVLKVVRGTGQAIARPGRSAHQRGLAIDIGGPSAIDKIQVSIVRMVAKANPSVLSGKVLRERNGCVHFELTKFSK
jgi:hypothetical protein